jgi:hypothetical protein
MSETRPDPDAILARTKREEREASGRGRLRIYLGAFPGVGKICNESQGRWSLTLRLFTLKTSRMVTVLRPSQAIAMSLL